MAMYKSAEDFLVLSMKTAEQYDCWFTDDCAEVLLEDIKNSINEDIVNGIEDDRIEIWHDLIEHGLKTFTVYMVFEAKAEDISELDCNLFDRSRQQFTSLWPCPRQVVMINVEHETGGTEHG